MTYYGNLRCYHSFLYLLIWTKLKEKERGEFLLASNLDNRMLKQHSVDLGTYCSNFMVDTC